MPDEPKRYEYTVIARAVESPKEHIDRTAINDDQHTGIADLEGKAGGARNAQEAAAEGSMILQQYLKLKPSARDR